MRAHWESSEWRFFPPEAEDIQDAVQSAMTFSAGLQDQPFSYRHEHFPLKKSAGVFVSTTDNGKRCLPKIYT
jgi:hypothetical protein